VNDDYVCADVDEGKRCRLDDYEGKKMPRPEPTPTPTPAPVAMTLVLPMPTAPIQITFATLLKMAINAG
jgi:hypothetical protein